MTTQNKATVAAMKRDLARQKQGYGLAGAFHTDAGHYALDLEHIFYQEWLFAGHTCQITKPGQWFTLQVGAQPIVVLRGEDGSVRAFHNVCRHRGYRVCDAAKGQSARRLVCPYHQWAYELNGDLARARDMQSDIDPKALGLKPVHACAVAGYIFICLAKQPPDFAQFSRWLTDYTAPFDLEHAKVAFESRIVEKGNWKLVWENNRECYHCRGSHPELTRTFPETPSHSGAGDPAMKQQIDDMIAKCEKLGMPGKFVIASDFQHRLMRLPLEGDARSMTMTGKPAVSKRLGICPEDENIGDILCYHYPTTWNHYTADHALSFRVLPISPTETELVSRWLVRGDAVEGRDYDVTTLTEVWMATNEQDTHLVERTQAGVTSPAYEPGPFSALHEDGCIKFVDWYRHTMERRLAGGAAMMVAAE